MTDRRATALYVASIVLALLIAVLARDTLGFAVQNAQGGWDGDLDHYVYWTRLVTLNGVQDAYSGTWPETYAVYPPVTLYAYQALGELYRATQDPSFTRDAALQSLWLRAGIKMEAVIWHLLTGLAIFFLVRRFSGTRRGALAATLYTLNPAALLDAADWGQPDGAHSLFSVLAIGFLDGGAVAWAFAALAFAMLSKPQAWALAPLIGVATIRQRGWLRLIPGVLGGFAAALVIVLPFIVTGHLADFLTLPGEIAGVMPVVSAHAHNLWWIVGFLHGGGDPLYLPDSATLVHGLSYRTVAEILVASQLLLTLWLYWTRRVTLAEAGALGALGWFVFTTSAHENHLLFVLPLLSLAWPRNPRLLIPFGVLTLTVFLNMALHEDPLLMTLGLPTGVPSGMSEGLNPLRLANAGLNVACFVVWAVEAARRRAGSAVASAWPASSAHVDVATETARPSLARS